MRNKKLILLLFALLLCYLVSQIILYALSQKRTAQGKKHHGNEEDKFAFVQKRNSQMDPLWNLKDFLELTQNEGIPIILLDPKVLQHVISPTPTKDKNCMFFCNGSTSTLMAVSYQMWTHNKGFLDKLRYRGFSVLYFNEMDRDALHYLATVNGPTIITHYLFHRGQHTIHQVILYTAPAGYLYIGGIDSNNAIGDVNETTNIWLTECQTVSLFTHSRAFNSMEFIKVTMDGLRLRAPKYPQLFLDELPDSTFLACNHTRARLFMSLYGDASDEDSDAVSSFRDANRQILAQAKKTLDKLGIRFWLSSGTCLGWYRQCDPIHYSGDVDIGIFIADYDKRLIPSMEQSGLLLRHIFGKESDSFELSFVNEDIKLDIFFFYEEADIMWNGGTRARTGQKYKYIFPKFTLCWTEFLGVLVRVPCDTEKYIEANYGKNWFEPVKQWDWKSSPSNVVENGHWPESEWRQVIQTFN